MAGVAVCEVGGGGVIVFLWMFCCLLPAEVPGVARRQVTFFASPKKVTKERRPQVRRPFGVPFAIQGRPAGSQNSDSVALNERLGSWLVLKHANRTAPVVPVLLGDSHGDPKVKNVLRDVRN